ncbi:rCG37916 [Rattus norvegicus]|uniref:RCG37916 n=1 Tax=Rattus norvegicus TaxID=10116 RepID=A6K5T2_RAT|nr:rCG37916 [Rattus norvegicus]
MVPCCGRGSGIHRDPSASASCVLSLKERQQAGLCFCMYVCHHFKGCACLHLLHICVCQTLR